MRIIATFLTIFAACSFCLFAEEPVNPPQEEMPNAGNQTCPVSGKQVNGVDSYVYNGKVYNLCSKGCKASLSKNPEQYFSEETQASE